MTSVELIQPEGTKPEGGMYCEWMPYQIKGKATGSESGEKGAGTEAI